ncbi:NAD(P)H-hydrate dehydratase [Sphingomonas corticis]|uniref:Bifunctional NAD(P)H-hydrate repair enzyme n=1 Tax=Sphingomonas corticis TaxID=2722791 RepID=A0ABX1CJI8_9SPHN|nr:NAD(P)H-hydrate dehydratase [Sphingomonas corticis]
MIDIEGQPILTAARMRTAEGASGDSAETLMARAGAAIAVAVDRLAAHHEVLVACGPGNNGGDGYVAAARLAALGRRVRVAASAEPRTPAAIAARAGWAGAVEPLTHAVPAPVLVDALFGTGLSRALEEDAAAALRRLSQRADLVIAIDLPSGLATDDGAVLSETGADVTLALGAAKPAHVLLPAAARCGEIRLLDIGVAAAGDDAVLPHAALSVPATDAHKYSRGMVAIVAGRMPGAAAMAAEAAARLAGYVLLLGSATDRLPHAVVRRRWSAETLADPRIGAVVIGPGLGRDDDARAKLDAALATDRPLVIDGDALHLLDPARLRGRGAATVLTPHGGEFAALFGDGEASRIERARAAAVGCGATVVMKGADTVVAHADGRTRVAMHRVSWLASAGTGDVLAGIVGGLLSGGRDPFDAAGDAVWLHTEAARRAGSAFLADDLPDHLTGAIAACL